MIARLAQNTGLGLGGAAMTLGLFALAAYLTTQHAPRQDIIEPVGVSLVELAPPEPPQQEEVSEPEPPPAEEQPEFMPDLVQPSVGGVDLGGIAMKIDIGDVGERTRSAEFIFDAADLDQAPQAQVRVQPEFPYRARERGVEGYVAVKFLVREDGSVGNVNILKAKPEGMFEEAVRRALPQWRFQPGRIGEDPVPSWVVTTIRFDLN